MTSHKHLKELAERSRFWDVEDLLRNLDLEMERLERGLDHLAWGTDERLLTAPLRPMPVTPRFVDESTSELAYLKVMLPDMPKENVSVSVEKNWIEVFACKDDVICRPYYLSLEMKENLDPSRADAVLSDGVLVIRVPKMKKRRVEVKGD